MRRDQIAQRACAAVLVGHGQDLLVVCANDELHYTRRLEADPKLLELARGGGTGTTAAMPLGFEYQPGGDFEINEAESPFIVELQRSFDVWDRSWPQLPLARLYVLAEEGSEDIAGLVQRELGVQAFALDPGPALPARRQPRRQPAACGPAAPAGRCAARGREEGLRR